MTSTPRSRRSRAREKAGRRCYRIEADQVALEHKLVVGGFLDPMKTDDHEAVQQALERMVDDIEIE